MNIADIIGATTITKVWEAVGGDRPKHGRAAAFYRNGDNPQAVSLNDAKGCWYDYPARVGGGVLDLIQRVLACDRPTAVRWLSEFTGLPLENRKSTPAERREHAQRHARAQQLAREVRDFEHGLELYLERHQENAAAVIPWLSAGLDDLDEIFVGAARGLALLQKTDADSLVALYRKLPEEVRHTFRDAGRLDREDAEALTRTIVTILAAVPRGEEAEA